MHDLQATDLHHLNAASGWLGLGCPNDAREELGKLSAAKQTHPAVLDLRWLIASQEKNWPEALSIAEAELKKTPESASGWLHRAYALRRVNEDGLIVATLTGQDSGMLTPLAKANALLRRPPFQEALAPGTLVEIIRLTL